MFDIFLIFAQNIDCGYKFEAVLTSTHNLCFGAKIRKIGIPLQIPSFFFFYIKVGFKEVYISRTCFPYVGIRRYSLFWFPIFLSFRTCEFLDLTVKTLSYSVEKSK